MRYLKSLPIRVFEFQFTQASAPLEFAVAWLIIGALFFGMRSCEYLSTPKAKEQHTKTICVENRTFFRHKRMVPHNSPYLGLADCVSITFVDQKNARKYDIITMYKTNHPLLNPVQAWTYTVRHIISYPGFDSSWPVNTWFVGTEKRRITSSTILQDLHAVVYHFGKDNMGFEESDVGTHLIHSSCAMLMYLDSIPVFTIMLVGR